MNSEAEDNMDFLPCLSSANPGGHSFGPGNLLQTREPELSKALKPCSEPRPELQQSIQLTGVRAGPVASLGCFGLAPIESGLAVPSNPVTVI